MNDVADKQRLDRDFTELYRAHLRDVYSYAYYRIGNHHDAEDLTEQTFLQAYRHFDRAQRESNGRPLRPWLIRIAHNLATNYYRDRSRRPQTNIDDAGAISTPHTTEGLVQDRDDLARILRGEYTPARLWSVSGAVKEPGCYEAPLDVTTRQLVDDYAGGATEEIGAVVPGGAASGIIPPAALDAPLTRDALREWGSGPGSAAVQVFPKRYPVLRLLAETMRFFAEESCQKCTPCRIGNRALHAVFEGERAMSRARADEWLDAMALTSICGLGQAAPAPVRNALAHWPELFEKMIS